MSVRMIFATIFATQNTREWHMWVVTWVMWPYIFLRLSKFTRQKTTQPWWPLLPSYYYAATSNRDMAGGERHHQRPYYAMMIDDILPSSWLAHKTTSNIVHHLMTWKYSSLTTCIVSSIKDCCGAVIVPPDRYICKVASGTLHWPIWPLPLAQDDIHMICIKIEFYSHLH